MEQEYFEIPYTNVDYQIKFDYYNISKYEMYRRAKLYINGAVWGSFSIIGSPFNAEPESIPNLMEINIDHPYRNLGFAKLLIQQMIIKIQEMESHIDPNILLYVDSDITDGFFHYIGCRNSYNPNFDKQINFENLNKYAFI
jgi:hypothetical protein